MKYNKLAFGTTKQFNVVTCIIRFKLYIQYFVWVLTRTQYQQPA